MTTHPHAASAPGPHDVVDVLDARTNLQVSAVVVDIKDGRYVLRFDRVESLQGDVVIRWYDGDAAWQARSSLDPLDQTTATCELAQSAEWQPAAPRASTRVPVDKAPVLIRIVQSTALSPGHRVHAICLDISATGCRASWPGRSPHIGDTVEITFDPIHPDPHGEAVWIPARVAAIIPRPFGATQIDLEFRTTTHAQAVRVRACHQSWQQEHRRRSSD